MVGEPVVDRAHGRPGLHPHPGATVEHLDAGEARPGVDHDAVAERLARQRGAAAAEGQGHAEAGAGPHHLGDVGEVARRREGLRVEQVVGGVVGVGQQVQRSPGDGYAVPERALQTLRERGQDAPLPSSSAMCSACRIASATIVSVGFAAAPVVITEPSLT